MRVTLALLFLVLMAGCQYNPHAHTFTTSQPDSGDVAGIYELSEQRVAAGGLAVLQGRQCELTMLTNGTFSLTNYPAWTSAFSPTNGQIVAFLSTTGRWSCDTVGIVYDGRTNWSHWGVRFKESTDRIDTLALTGKTPPYGLIMTYGDPDSGMVMIFKKKQ